MPFGLTAPVWTRASHRQFPQDFQNTLEAILLGRCESETHLPAELWLERVFPFVPKKWFVPSETPAEINSICDFLFSTKEVGVHGG